MQCNLILANKTDYGLVKRPAALLCRTLHD